MPKYFTTEIPLPFEKIAIKADELTIERVTQILDRNETVSLAVELPGLENNCVGYVINLIKTETEIVVCDITKKALFSLESTAEVTSLAKHAIGYEFSQEIYDRFLKLRDIS